ncbi:MAG: DUF1330 domain-containing protein, partial [Candidatus Hydrogenedentota bacterium]
MPFIDPSPEMLEKFKAMDIHGAVHMVNLLKFKGARGLLSYAEYAAHIASMLAERDARIVYQAMHGVTLIGDETWDSIVIVEYPSCATYLEMFESDAYQNVAHFRNDALESSRLYCIKAEHAAVHLENLT